MNELKELVMELEELTHKAKAMLKKQGMGQRGGYGNNSGSNGYGGGSMGQRRNMGYREDWDDYNGGSNYDPRFMD